jgi:hypothetical protein
MAAMTTALTPFSEQGNNRTYTYTGHTVQDPRLVLQKRTVPTGNKVVAEDVITVLSGTEDADSVPLPERVTFAVTVRRPVTGASADVTAALAVFRDIVAGDEFANTVDTQEPLV